MADTLPASLDALADALVSDTHTLALPAGSDALRLATEQALKDVFQLGTPPLAALLSLAPNRPADQQLSHFVRLNY